MKIERYDIVKGKTIKVEYNYVMRDFILAIVRVFVIILFCLLIAYVTGYIG